MWSCCKTGQCCEQVREVVMTHEERVEIERAVPPGVVLSFASHDDSRFTRLLAAPCPLLKDQQCSVYAVRPYRCRTWGCFRDDYSQPPEMVPIPAAMLKNRSNRRQALMMERKARRWGWAHGWDESMTGEQSSNEREPPYGT